jgi:hypothetical protein
MLPVPLDCVQLHAQDARFVNAVARCCLAARRNGAAVRLSNVDQGMLELLDLCGLVGVLGLEARREAEQGEQPLGIEEEGQLRNPSA